MASSRRASLAALVCAAGIAITGVVPATSAASTYVFPGGQTLPLGSANVEIPPMGLTSAVPFNCTLNGGSVAIPGGSPANPSATSVTASFATIPSFTSCTGFFAPTVTTSGRWTMTIEYGFPTRATVNVPAGGITAEYGGCIGTQAAAGTFTGYWQNGYTFPTSVDTAVGLSGGPALTWGCTGTYALGMSTGALTVRATNPRTGAPLLPVVGP